MLLEEFVLEPVDRKALHRLDTDLVHCSVEMLDDMEAVNNDLRPRETLLDELNVGVVHVHHDTAHALTHCEIIPVKVANERW